MAKQQNIDREGFQFSSTYWRAMVEGRKKFPIPKGRLIPVGKKAAAFEREYRAMKEAKLPGKER